MTLKRSPGSAPRPIVESLWAIDQTSDPSPIAPRREHVLPTGQMHVVLRLSDDPLRVYCRVLRFQRALRRLPAAGFGSWLDVAMAAGYSAQAHFNREFRECVGVTPTAYRQASPRFPHHVPIVDARR